MPPESQNRDLKKLRYTKKPRVIFLTQWFDPEPTIRGNKFVEKLATAGYDIEVVTGFPNYPTGRIYPGFKLQSIVKEQRNAYTLTRLWLFPNHSQNVLLRALNYLSFAFSSLIYLTFFAPKFDLLYVYHPPLTTALVGSLVKAFRRVRLILDVQDLWPDTLSSTGMITHKLMLKFLGLVCKIAYRSADKISVLSPGFRKLLINRNVNSDKIETIYNWANEYDRESIKASGRLAKDKFNILLAGNMGPAQDIETIILAAKIISSKQPEIHIVLVGGGIYWNRIDEQIKTLNLENISIHQQVSPVEIRNDYELADVLLVHLKKDPLFAITIPSRTQTCLYAGKPILMCVDGDAAGIVVDAKAGQLAESGNSEAIAEAMLSLYNLSSAEREQMGKNGQKFYYDQMSLDVAIKKLARLFCTVLQ